MGKKCYIKVCQSQTTAENALGLAFHALATDEETAEKWRLAANCP